MRLIWKEANSRCTSRAYTDTDDTTCLHVPSIGLVVAGDAVYNGIHPFLSESNRQTRLARITALAKIDALKPLAVVAGHKIPGNDDKCGRNAPVYP